MFPRSFAWMMSPWWCMTEATPRSTSLPTTRKALNIQESKLAFMYFMEQRRSGPSIGLRSRIVGSTRKRRVSKAPCQITKRDLETGLVFKNKYLNTATSMRTRKKMNFATRILFSLCKSVKISVTSTNSCRRYHL